MLRIANADRSPDQPAGHPVTVLFGTEFDGWDMPPFQPRTDGSLFYGGQRALVELAGGLAAAGFEVELRGNLPEEEVVRIEQAAGVRIGRPSTRRSLEAEDTVIMPEGHRDPLLFARVAFSPARTILFVQGAMGMFGWSFDGHPTPTREEMLTLDPATVGRPEQLEAARNFGFELWTNLMATAAQARAAGIPMHYIGAGRPIPYPEPASEKEIDVLVMGDNRWTPLATRVLEQLPAGVRSLALPRLSHAEVLSAFSLARVLVHPSRIEGRSRLVEEARAMRTVPVVLSSNTLGEGYGEEYGSVVVDSLEEMAPAIVELLADPERLQRLAENAYRSAREIGDWSAYQDRLRTALDSPDEHVRATAPGRARLGASFHALVGSVSAQMAQAQQQIAAAVSAIEHERVALAAERAALQQRP